MTYVKVDVDEGDELFDFGEPVEDVALAFRQGFACYGVPLRRAFDVADRDSRQQLWRLFFIRKRGTLRALALIIDH